MCIHLNLMIFTKIIRGFISTARQLCINIYQRVAPAALAFVSEKGETSVGELPAPGSLYFQRFGGLNIEQEALCQFIR